jgi:prepilin-type N-terminal cleavage/methylation domain-containing protein
MNRPSQAGFTLIEIMAAMVLLSFLSWGTIRTVQDAVASKKKHQYEIARDASLRDATRVMQNDIAAAFNSRDLNVDLYNAYVKSLDQPAADAAKNPAGQNPGGLAGQPPPAQPVIDPQGAQQDAKPKPTPKPIPTPLTGFIGDDKSVFLTVSNHRRSTYDAPESDLARVGYFTRDCTSRDPKKKNVKSKCLIRSFSTTLTDDVSKVGAEFVLLENLKEFKLRYIAPDKSIGDSFDEAFSESWRSDGKRQGSTAGYFPLAVEIDLTIHDPDNVQSKPTSMTALAPLNFPNNPDPKADSDPSSSGARTK